MSQSAWEKYRLKTLILAMLFLLLGLVCLLGEQVPTTAFWKSVLNELATALMIGGLWTAAYELVLRQDFTETHDSRTRQVLDAVERTRSEVAGTLDLADREHTMGLFRVHASAEEFDFVPWLRDAKSFTAVLNDGRTWTSRHSANLRERLKDPSKSTTIVLLHPDSPALAVMARKVGSSVEALQSKIQDTVGIIRDSLPDPRSLPQNVRVLGHLLYNSHSVFLTDTHAALTPYFISRGRKTVPVFVFQDTGTPTGMFTKITEDIDQLIRDDTKVLVETTAESE